MAFRRVLLVLGLVVASLLLFAPPASAGTTSVGDPRGDGHGTGDIRGVRVTQDGGVVRFQIRTQKPLDVTTAPAWTNTGSVTFLRFNIDANGGGIDHVVLLTASPSGPSLEYTSIAHGPSPRRPCALLEEQPDPTIIRVNVATGCLDGTSIRVFARYGLDKAGNESLDSDDRGPNTGWVPTLGLN